jgi:opacity protein-like surface antigen
VTKLANRSTCFLVLAFLTGIASAQSDKPWDGFYAGLSVGEASNNTCNTWTAGGATTDPATVPAFYNQNCAGGSFVGGVQIGENFQYKRLVWGVGADLDAWRAKNQNSSLKFAGEVPPPGTYAFSGKLGPSSFGIFGPRIGYAGDQWLPYVRAGAILTDGSQNSSISYTPNGATKPTASFNGGKGFGSSGWAMGGGVEYGLNGPWSITAEYLHANLGKGSNSTATCTGTGTGTTVAACAAFSGVSFDSVHTDFAANIFRIGVNYWFNYWGR